MVSELGTTHPARLKALIAEEYDRGAAGFAGTADAHVYRFLAAPLAARLRGLPGPVLDVATGTGALGCQLPDAVGVDLSHVQLLHNRLCRRVRADAEALPFPDGAFAASACAFGLGHFPDPAAAVGEMARVAPVVGVLTWARPASPYAPKESVLAVVARHAGAARTPAGRWVDERSDRVGSVAAVRALLLGAGLRATVGTVDVAVPWPGAAAFVDYRLSLLGAASLLEDPEAARQEAVAAVAALPAAALRWRPRLVLGVGRRQGRSVRPAP